MKELFRALFKMELTYEKLYEQDIYTTGQPHPFSNAASGKPASVSPPCKQQSTIMKEEPFYITD